MDDWSRQFDRARYLHEGGFYDREGRLGFSFGGHHVGMAAARHRAFDAVGDTSLHRARAGETALAHDDFDQ